MHTGFNTKLKKYCKSCHQVEEADLYVEVQCQPDDTTGKCYTANVLDNNTMEEVSILCSTCGSEDTVLLDYHIADIISKLNMKGYKTEFSCDGEIDDINTASLPYITFGPDTPADIFNSLPSGWYVDCNADFNSICVVETGDASTTSVYYYVEDGDEWNIEWDVNAMNEWADNLPDNDI